MDAEHSALVHFAPDWWGHQIPRGLRHLVNFCAMTEETRRGCAACGDDVVLTQDPDVLDLVLVSAWPFSTLGWPMEHLRLSGIIRPSDYRI